MCNGFINRLSSSDEIERKREEIKHLLDLFLTNSFDNDCFLSLTHHTLAVLDVLRPVLILPAEEGGEGDDDRHDPDGGDQHPDRGRVPRVDVVGVCHGPIPAQQSNMEICKLNRFNID